jgi:hypothetical protein
VDRNVAVQIKRQMAALLEQRMIHDDTFFNEWLGLADGTYPAWKCRVLVTQLLGEAWEKLVNEKDFRKLGLETGNVMPVTGLVRSDHDLPNVIIPGVLDYTFPTPVANDHLVEH